MDAPEWFLEIASRVESEWDDGIRNAARGRTLVAGMASTLWGELDKPMAVVSELLQNADDAGANTVRVSLSPESCLFESRHAKGFNKSDLDTLCNYDKSRKSPLEHIGTHGIGFKTVFSVAREARIQDAELDFSFRPDWRRVGDDEGARKTPVHITTPRWHGDHPFRDGVRTTLMGPRDGSWDGAFLDSLRDWAGNPVALLFLKSVESLTIETKLDAPGTESAWSISKPSPMNLDSTPRPWTLQAEDHEPVAGWLVGRRIPFDREVARRAFDREVKVDEIGIQVAFPNVHPVEIFRGGLYSCLPIPGQQGTIWAANAPFSLEKNRSDLGSSSSDRPWNEFLLHAIGGLLADGLLSVLKTKNPAEDLLGACLGLLPPAVDDSRSEPIRRAHAQIETAFLSTLAGEGFPDEDGPVLCTDGRVRPGSQCVAVDQRMRSWWSDENVLAAANSALGPWVRVAGVVHPALAQSTVHWENSGRDPWWQDLVLDSVSADDLDGVPIPAEDALADFLDWCYAHNTTRQVLPAIDGRLHCADRVTRLGSESLTGIREIDDRIGRTLNQFDEAQADAWQRLLPDRGPDDKGPKARQRFDAAVQQASLAPNKVLERLFDSMDAESGDRDGVARLDPILYAARLGLDLPDNAWVVTEDGGTRRLSEGVIGILDKSVVQALGNYNLGHATVTREYQERWKSIIGKDRLQRWTGWLRRQSTGFLPIPPLEKVPVPHSYDQRKTESDLIGELQDRLLENARGAVRLQRLDAAYQGRWAVVDWDFGGWWYDATPAKKEALAKILTPIVEAHERYFKERALIDEARYVTRTGEYDYEGRVLGEVPSKWLHELLGQPCFLDGNGKPHILTEMTLVPEAYAELDFLFEQIPRLAKRHATSWLAPHLPRLGLATLSADYDGLKDALAGKLRGRSKAKEKWDLCKRFWQWASETEPHISASILEDIADDLHCIPCHDGLLVPRPGALLPSKEPPPDGYGVIDDHDLSRLRVWHDLGIEREPPIASGFAILEDDRRVGEQLNEGIRSRVTSLLREHSNEAWHRGRWLSLAGTIEPLAGQETDAQGLRWKLTERCINETRLDPNALRPEDGRLVADFRMIDAKQRLMDLSVDDLPDVRDSFEWEPIDQEGREVMEVTNEWLRLWRYLEAYAVDPEAKASFRSLQDRTIACFMEPIRAWPIIDGLRRSESPSERAFLHTATTVMVSGGYDCVAVQKALLAAVEDLLQDSQMANRARDFYREDHRTIARFFEQDGRETPPPPVRQATGGTPPADDKEDPDGGEQPGDGEDDIVKPGGTRRKRSKGRGKPRTPPAPGPERDGHPPKRPARPRGTRRWTAVVERSLQPLFRKALVAAYHNRCAICGIHGDLGILEAAHIRPVSLDRRQEANPVNGMLLCRNHHRLFDHGWLWIDADYVLRSHDEGRRFEDSAALSATLWKFDGREVAFLPSSKDDWPNQRFLSEHRVWATELTISDEEE